MRSRTVILAALAAAAVLAPHAGAAAPKAVLVKDIAGDANGANAQGFEDLLTQAPDNGTSTGPASVAAADIVSVKWASTIVKKKLTGFTITLTLGAAPTAGLTYRIEQVSPGCESLFAEYRVDPSGAAKTSFRCASTETVYKIAAAKITGSTITWTIPLAAVGKAFRAGTPLSNLGAQTRGFVWLAGQTVDVPELGKTTGFTVPQFDHITSAATFKIGS